MGDERWHADSAREALILLRQAHDAWTSLLPRGLEPHRDDDAEQTARAMHQHSASVLTWARGLDDMACDPNGLLGYPDTRSAPGVELVDAAVYGCNRAIHQLIAVGRYSPGGMSFPKSFPVRFESEGVKWVKEDRLPPATADNGPMRSRRRAAYLRRWAGQPMADGLDEIRAFMDAKIGPAVGL